MTDIKGFLSLNNLKKINKDLNDFIGSNRYEDGEVHLTWQGFVENQHVGSGRNGASTLVDLQKIIYECENIELVRPRDSNSSYLNIYLKASSHAGQGSNESFTRLRIKDKKGSIHTLDDMTVETLTNKFGLVYREINPVRVIGSNVIQLRPEEVGEEDISSQVYGEMIDAFKYHSIGSLATLIRQQGYEFIDVMEYTHKFSIFPESVKVLKNKITFTYMTFGTYNSLPVIMTIEKLKKFNKISLASLGIEKQGYYSHHDKMNILPEQKEEVMEFFNQFKKINK